MRLLECYIKNFGRLADVKYKFDRGLNAWCEENGWGKTTLTVFITSMFYGLNTDRKQSLDDNPRKKYAPWQGGTYGGTLTFAVGDKAYRIERTFGEKAANDTVRIIDVASGDVTRDFTPENIGFELFDINAEGFMRTVFISERGVSDIQNASIAAKLSKTIGTDGDVGSIDAAKKLLDKRKSFYKKTGNRGEIARLQENIRECDDRLKAVTFAESEMEKIDARLKELDGEISSYEEKKAALNTKYRLNIGRDARSKLITEYQTKLAALERDKLELQAHADFFRLGVPTEDEIDDVRDARTELEKLRRERLDREAPEYVRLHEFFKRPTDFGELEAMKGHLSRLTSLEDERRAVNLNLDFIDETMAERFPGRFPKAGEIDDYLTVLRWSWRHSLITAFTLIAAVFGVLGALIHPLFYVGLGFIFAALPILQSTLALSSKAKRFLEGNRIPRHGAALRLASLRREVMEHEASVAALNERVGALSREIALAEQPLSAFLSHYDVGNLEFGEALRLVAGNYEKLYALELSTRENELGRADRDVRITHLDGIVREFLSKYPTEDTEDPFREIRARLGAYKYTLRALRSRAEECEAFKLLHSIGDEEMAVELGGEMKAIESEIAGYEAEILRLRAERARISAEYDSAYRTASLGDEITAARELYAEKAREYTENYEVIVNTLEMLDEAATAITSRYIGTTEEKFEKYVSMIAGDAEGYSISTDFVIRKYDEGATREAESYSRGTRELHSLALKIALSDAMYEGRAPLLILDDPFYALDDDKLECAKRLIRELSEDRQILYFTCSRDRAI